MPSKKLNGGLTNPVAENYAAALFNLARQQDSPAAVNAELNQIAHLVADNDKLAALFEHRTIDAKRRSASIRTLFEGRVSDLTLRFLLLLNNKGRLDQTVPIAVALDKRVKHMAGEIDVEVHSARPLDAAQLTRVGDRITTAIGRKALIEPHVDESLIGGLRVRVGDKLIDGSVRAQLRNLARDLQTAGHEQVKARSADLLES